MNIYDDDPSDTIDALRYLCERAAKQKGQAPRFFTSYPELGALESTINEAREAILRKLKDIAANKEKYVEAWVAETGLHPSECVLIEKRESDGSTRFWIEKKGTNDRIDARL